GEAVLGSTVLIPENLDQFPYDIRLFLRKTMQGNSTRGFVAIQKDMHFAGELAIGFDKDTLLNDTLIQGVGKGFPNRYSDSIWIDNLYSPGSVVTGRVNGKTLRDISCSTNGEEKTWLFKVGTESSFSLTMELSEDKKRIVFHDLDESLLEGNCTTLLLYALPDSVLQVYTEQELRAAA
ncbi:MAG: hypothetical protein PUC47_07340, partial [Oscillospiraceae bacterium]|nr:hypothetical protein [Oscillospiraceae bacterium]